MKRNLPMILTVFLSLLGIQLQAASPKQIAFSSEKDLAPKRTLAMLPSVNVTVLVEGMAGYHSVLGEWGVSFLIESGQHQILFDTGRGQTLLHNAKALNVDLSKTDAIVMSHAHTDHSGGIEKAIKVCSPIDLYAHPGAFQARYWKWSSQVLKIGPPISIQQARDRVRSFVETEQPTDVCDGVMVTGEIPRRNDFESEGGLEEAFLDERLETPDPVLDDQALFFRTPEGLVIVLGCGHSGVVNTMEYVCEILGEEKIYALIGGTHLLGAPPNRMIKTIGAILKYDVQKLMLTHCTGMDAYVRLAKAFPGRCSWPASGTTIRFGQKHPKPSRQTIAE